MVATITKTLILMCFSATASAENLSGQWLWDENNDSQHFSIAISISDNAYVATYCAIGVSVTKIDCGKENAFTFELNKSFNFTTHFERTEGRARLTLADNKLIWSIMTKPNGEYYAPLTASLIKQNTDY